MPRDVARTGAGFLALTGSSQALIPANASRIELTVCNPTASNAMWLAFSVAPTTSTGPTLAPTAAANTGLRLGPGQSYTTTNYRGAVAIIGTAADTATWIEL